MTPQEHQQQKKAARDFVDYWQAAEGSEEAESRTFWLELFEDVLGVRNAKRVLKFEHRVQGRKIDVFHEDVGVLIEQKSRGINLDAPEPRGKEKSGAPRLVTPYEQAKWYADNLPHFQRPRWLVLCNFDEIRIHDLNDANPATKYETLHLAELPDQLHRLSFLTRKENSRLEREKQLSVEAGAIVGKLYDALATRYHNIDADPAEQRSLNILITRLVFLLYAEDADLLQAHQAFYHYLKDYNEDATASALRDLFTVLRTPEEARSKLYVPEKAKAFPYINGGLFADDSILIPPFDAPARALLLQEASAGFDWKDISPTIFGAVFESTLNPETRRAGGMHYTSIENIHKVTDPLFFDALRAELAQIEGEKQQKKREFLLHAYRKKLAALKIFDPACGSGNFLTETYIGLRKLENRVLQNIHGEQKAMGAFDPIQVSIHQFYGVEINDFAVEVAKTALWIAELQMLEQTQQILDIPLEPLPLKDNANIHCANALRTDWNEVLPAEQCSYIIGNPPFVGASKMNAEQKNQIVEILGKRKRTSSIDYVVGWYYKSVDYIARNAITCAFVSTSSITQGEQVKTIWEPLIKDKSIEILFAHLPFEWESEATDVAAVWCVIIGFGINGRSNNVEKKLFNNGQSRNVSHITPYLREAATDVLIEPSAKHIQGLPKMVYGNKPTDGGNFLFTDKERDAFLQKNPDMVPFMHPCYGAAEFLKRKQRYCLWLADVDESAYIGNKDVCERIENVRQLRLASSSCTTVEAANYPHRFYRIPYPPGTGDYLAIPEVTTIARKYIPIGFMSGNTVPTNKLLILPNATLFEFGVLSSTFHNAWASTVSGRLGNGYQYSAAIVYNNMVFPNANAENKACIERCAQAVLDARAAHPDKTLAQLYDPDKMPANLRAAHHALDAAVESAYGVDFGGDEEKITAHLFQLSAAATKAAW